MRSGLRTEMRNIGVVLFLALEIGQHELCSWVWPLPPTEPTGQDGYSLVTEVGIGSSERCIEQDLQIRKPQSQLMMVSR